MDFKEKIKNDQLLIVIKKLAFLGELKKYFYEKDLISLEDILNEETYYLQEMKRLEQLENKTLN
ncbi:hypothetical protein PMU71_03105 [Enterococcus durans]|uniref:hypothetical protein n=1 Tax=Enterococcus durans TaxID=53345 RepID=UPI00232F99A5|nr:hypothetical protein [Enterococcus durans]MDB1681424.1 hypothetical protein [Enterococcus durans]